MTDNSAPTGIRTVKAIVFPGGFNWPIFAAQDLGLFEAHGLEVAVVPTTNSKQQMAGQGIEVRL